MRPSADRAPPRSASDIARETIRQLAARRIAPTPDHYAAVYYEISGLEPTATAPGPQRVLEAVAAGLARTGGSHALMFERAVAARRWDDAVAAVPHLLERTDEPALGAVWADATRELLRAWDARQPGVTPARKREQLEHVLVAFGNDASKLAAKLRALIRSWGEGRAAEPVALAPPGDAEDHAADTAALLRTLLVDLARLAIVEQLGFSPSLADEARRHAERLARARTATELAAAGSALRGLLLRIELAGETQAALVRALHSLLGLVVDNLGELVENDAWIRGQVEQVRTLLGGPLTLRSVEHAERALRGLIYKQALAKQSFDQAKHALKDLLATFVDRLGAMAAATGDYQEKLGRYARAIEAAEDLGQLGALVSDLSQDVRTIQADAVRTRDELVAARAQAAEQAARARSLERELEEASQLVRQDALTRALNRRGLDEACFVESARAERSGEPLSLAILDVDNFKAINDRFGHDAGDRALVHLAAVIRESLRPSDVVARYGGEEFVILLPATGISDAVTTMQRVQRELTRRFFMHNNERVLVTFSAGVTERRPGESQQEVIARADRGLLQAKREGKNRVVAIAAPEGLSGVDAGAA